VKTSHVLTPSFSPWWDHCKQQLSEWLTFEKQSKVHSRITWIRKIETQPSHPTVEIKPQFQEMKKIVKHSNNLSKQELADDEVL
jgi:hypothetical protein